MKIRIALVINSDGEWNSCGWSKPDSEYELMEIAADGMEASGGEARYWIEAEVEVPSTQTIQANLKKEN